MLTCTKALVAVLLQPSACGVGTLTAEQQRAIWIFPPPDFSGHFVRATPMMTGRQEGEKVEDHFLQSLTLSAMVDEVGAIIVDMLHLLRSLTKISG